MECLMGMGGGGRREIGTCDIDTCDNSRTEINDGEFCDVK